MNMPLNHMKNVYICTSCDINIIKKYLRKIYEESYTIFPIPYFRPYMFTNTSTFTR